MNIFQPIVVNKVEQERIAVNVDDHLTAWRKELQLAGTDDKLISEAICTICNVLIDVDSAVRRESTIESLRKEFKLPKKYFTEQLKSIEKARKNDDEGESSPLITRVENFINKRYDIRYNEVSNQFEWRDKDAEKWENLNENIILRRLRKDFINYSTANLIELLKSDFTPRMNPIKHYFHSLPAWDGDDHIIKLASYIHLSDKSAEETDRFNRMFKKMFVRSIACSFEIAFNKQAFILVHEEQNSGKSTFLRWICPKPLQDYYTENISTDKDSLIALTENFIVNLDELSTLNKAEINALKSVMSKDKVKVRIPYERRPAILQRRCNFVGSTNRLEFLNDETGNVRWVCFLIQKINWAYTNDLSIDKIWAQAYYLFKSGEFEYNLTAKEIKENEQANTQFIIRTPELELLQKIYSPSDEGIEGSMFKTATEILEELNKKVPSAKITNVGVGKALKMLGYKRDGIRDNEVGYTVKGYWVREVNNTNGMQIENDYQTKIGEMKKIPF